MTIEYDGLNRPIKRTDEESAATKYEHGSADALTYRYVHGLAKLSECAR